jgi:hypothetical protein
MLFRKQQIAAAVETTYGTAVSLAAANAKHLVIEPSLVVEPPLYLRNHIRGTLTADEGLIGIQPGTMVFKLEMAGQAIATPDIPTWDIFMKGCGWRSAATRKITIGAITDPPFRHGETVTQTTSGATAKVIHDTYGTTMYVHEVTGTPTTTGGHTWVGGTSGASAQPSTVDTDTGQSWWPYSTETVTLLYTGAVTGSLPAGTIVQGNTSLAKGIIEAHDTTAKNITVRVYSGTFTTEVVQ